MRSLPLALAATLALLAGCTTPALLSPASVAPALPSLLAGSASLWPDHQNEPHPAWDWPTLAHPATGKVPAFWAPIENATLPSDIKGLEHVARSPDAVKAGAGIALFGSIALVPTEQAQNYVLDIHDPLHPQLLSTYDGAGERGATIMAMPDGRLYGVVATAAGF